MKKSFKLLIPFIIMAFITGCSSTSSNISTSKPKISNTSYKKAIEEHFDEIASAFGNELESITCLNNDCSSSVVYFNFNTVPDDLEFVIKGNAITYSNLKYNLKGVSGVTVIATLNGNTIYKCDARGGMITQCE